MKKLSRILNSLTLFTLLSSVLSPALSVSALTDDFILTSPVAAVYAGRPEAKAMIANLNYTDVPAEHWAKDAITRAGALDMVKGYAKTFKPDAFIANDEAIALILRALGLEKQAQAAAVALRAGLPADSPLLSLWSSGYLSLARDMGLISDDQYADTLTADQSVLDPSANFMRGGTASRQRVADWLARALLTIDKNIFPPQSQQKMYTAADWASIDADKVNGVEAILQNNIMTVNAGGSFRPNSAMTRAETAQMLKNMDGLYYNAVGILKKKGTVGAVRDSQETATGSARLTRDIYVRADSGIVEVLRYELSASSSPQAGERDAVTLKNGDVDGLAALVEGDRVEYLIRAADNVILYVQVTSDKLDTKTIQGALDSVDAVKGTVTILWNGKKYTYPMAEGLYGTEDNAPFVKMDGQNRAPSTLPYGSTVTVRLKNDVADLISYVGEPVLTPETRGIVTENNAALGYLTVIDPQGRSVTKAYYESDLKVKKREYYDMSDEAGCIGQVFPNFGYNPLETDISAIEAGDIVFFRLDPDDAETILEISAATNYTTRYGKITQFSTDGELSSMLVEFENKQSAWFDAADSVSINKNGRPAAVSDIHVGDWASLLINQALIGPGCVMESVKEMAIEGDGHYISAIVKGQLSGLDAIQNKLVIQNAQTLAKTGWSNYKQIETFSIAAKDIEYYQDNKRVSQDYAVKNLKRASGDVYIALENNYAGERVRKVTFRSGRDELLKPDTVLSSDGLGVFSIFGNNGGISTDDGTIVVRDGRLVTGRQVMVSDYATVSLNGQNRAAVVSIDTRPGAGGASIARGRVLSVDEGKSFMVQSMSTLSGAAWNFTPVARQFAIDYNTVFINANGVVPMESFLGYTDATAINRVFNIVIDGSRAARVIDSPYANRAIRGTVYQTTDGVLALKDVTYLDNAANRWFTVGNTNATATVTIPVNAVIIKNNAAVGAAKLEIGDQVVVMTNALPAKPAPGMSVTGYIILVEK